jgi:hypothetical protein
MKGLINPWADAGVVSVKELIRTKVERSRVRTIVVEVVIPLFRQFSSDDTS